MSSSSCQSRAIAVPTHKSGLILHLSSTVYKSLHSQELWSCVMNEPEKATDSKRVSEECAVLTKHPNHIKVDNGIFVLLNTHPFSHVLKFSDLNCIDFYHSECFRIPPSEGSGYSRKNHKIQTSLLHKYER